MFLRHHIHSIMSARDAMLPLDIIIDEAKKHNEAFAITDHGSIAGWVGLYNKCKKEEIKPIFGVEAYINKHRDVLFDILEDLKDCTDKDEKKRLQTERDKLKKYRHIVLIAKNETGFNNLIQLANIGFVDGFYSRPTITYAELFHLKEGLIVTSACLGNDINQYILNDEIELAEEYAQVMKKELGDDFYLELQYNSIPEQIQVNKVLFKIAKDNDIKMIVGMDSHYLDYEWKETHQDLLLLQGKNKKSDVGKIDYMITWENAKGEIKTKKVAPDKEFRKGIPVIDLSVGDKIKKDTITDIKEVPRVWSFSGDALYLSEKELIKYAKENHKEIKTKDLAKTMEGNHKVYDKIEDFELNFDIKLPTIANSNKKLVELVKQGLKDFKFTKKKSYIARVKHELKVIKDNGFATYFLILTDFITYAREHGIPIGAGRGSGVSSLVAYVLGIHRVNPMEKRWNGMPFERFLAASRNDLKIVIFDDDGNKKEFTSSDIVMVNRKGEDIEVLADEMKEGDDFVEVVKRNIV